MKCPNCKFEFSAKELKMRSLPQLKYYWGVIIKTLSDELGYREDEMHEVLKMMFLSTIKLVSTKEGIKEIRIARSTGECTTSEIEDYYSTIRQWASIEMGILIMEPNEEEWDKVK